MISVYEIGCGVLAIRECFVFLGPSSNIACLDVGSRPSSFPVLSFKSAKTNLLLHRHLSDPSHRETYESAHSVVLAIFSAHAQKQRREPSSLASTASAWKIGFFGKGYGRTARTGQEPLDASGEGRVDSQESSISEDFAKRMVPFYAQCLIEVEFPALELGHPFLTFLCYRTLSKEG